MPHPNDLIVPCSIEGVLAKADEPNANGRTYSQEVLEQALVKPKREYGPPVTFSEPIADDDWVGQLKIVRARFKPTITTGRVAYYRNVNDGILGSTPKVEAIRVPVTISPGPFPSVSETLDARIQLGALAEAEVSRRLELVPLWSEQLSIIEQAHIYDPYFRFCYHARSLVIDLLIDKGDAT